MARHRLVVVVALATTVVLAGCADDTPTLPGTRSSAATATTGTASPSATTAPGATSSTSPEPTPIVDDCLSGRWVLDVADLEDQSVAWLGTTGVEVDSFEVTGSQRLALTDGRLDLVSDLRTRAVVGGRTLAWADTGAGGGGVSFSDGTLTAPTFAWRERPEPPPAGAPTVPATDWTRPVAWACTPAGLELRGEDAPLTARFVRP